MAAFATNMRACATRRGAVRVQAVAKPTQLAVTKTNDAEQMKVFKQMALSSVAASTFMAGQASAATEIATIAGDSRVGVLLSLFAPVVGWVLFNIFGPAKNQLDNMSTKGVAIGLGLAGLLAAGSAEAAQEVALTAGDSRVGILATLFLPVVGWVLFNIFGPAKNQLDNMSTKGAAIGIGMAGLLAAGSAEAAQEVAMTAGDGRIGILATLFLPVAGWVLFNIFGPAKNQLDNMSTKGAAVGLGMAGLLAAGSAEAAQEVATTAGDSRIGILALLFLPVVGWVLFNIFGPAKNQIDNMSKKSVATGLGLAGLLAAGSAEAAQEVAATAGDSRVGILGLVFLPVIGWVLFNIFGPAKNQLDNMSKK